MAERLPYHLSVSAALGIRVTSTKEKHLHLRVSALSLAETVTDLLNAHFHPKGQLLLDLPSPNPRDPHLRYRLFKRGPYDFVVWVFNTQTDGHVMGGYHQNIADALIDIATRLRNAEP